MKRLRELNRFRNKAWEHQMGRPGDDFRGCFTVPSPQDKMALNIIACNGEGWDHVSVSRPLRTPSWAELEHIKRLFFREDEVAIQLHVPSHDHVNIHPNCLHLWRPHDMDIPLPPKEFV
ncbi:MAG: hypothetical protein WCY11_05115 [Novosphingobium sp.]